MVIPDPAWQDAANIVEAVQAQNEDWRRSQLYRLPDEIAAEIGIRNSQTSQPVDGYGRGSFGGGSY